MPRQEVACAARPAMLLRRNGGRPRAVLLDGGATDSWVDGCVTYTDSPRATLEVFASGWGRWWCAGGGVRWRRACPLEQWQDFQDSAAAQLPPGTDSNAAGVLSVLSYDLKHWIERLPRRHPWPKEPVLYSALYDWRYFASYHTGKAWIGAASRHDLEEQVRWYETEAKPGKSRREAATPVGRPLPALSKAAYLRMIERAQQYIAAGDIYQVNLAQRFTALNGRVDCPALYCEWVERYITPFAAYVDAGDWAIVSNSPECFLSVDGDNVATFPIKGTVRVVSDEMVRSLADCFAHDPKERAEHVMIVDIERNDLGRVCEPGSVEVAEFARVRRYPLLLHMVSEVRGRRKPGTSLADLVRATFPGGSITGAPKIRAMEIIEELEPCPRGLYTGAIGWTELSGRSRFSLPIRTAVLTPAGLTYHAGGGIVADSDPQREFDETLLKAETLFRTLSSWEG